jgi:hypothetical protein
VVVFRLAQVVACPRVLALWEDDGSGPLQLARRYEGRSLATVTGKRFSVGVYLDCPVFTHRRRAASAGATAGRPPWDSWLDPTKPPAFNQSIK